jgi:hypothetical protein
MQRSVIVEHVEGGDFALILVATRSDYGRRDIVPMIFANKGCGLFSVAPQLNQWVKAGLLFVYDPPPDCRAELLKNAVNEFVRQVSQHSYICERSRVGVVARAKARSEEFDKPPEGFELSRVTEPAFAWLFEKSDAAAQALRVLRYLIQKNKIGELTQAQREAVGMKAITRGESLKNVFSPLKVWRQ